MSYSEDRFVPNNLSKADVPNAERETLHDPNFRPTDTSNFPLTTLAGAAGTPPTPLGINTQQPHLQLEEPASLSIRASSVLQTTLPLDWQGRSAGEFMPRKQPAASIRRELV